MTLAQRISSVTHVRTSFGDWSTIPVQPGMVWTLVSRAGGGSQSRVDRLVAQLGAPRRHLIVPVGPPTWHGLCDSHAPHADGAGPIIACGGGSTLDAAKIFRLLDHERYRGPDDAMLDQDVTLPALICVPTTCGSGAEQTPTASLWDDGRKRALDGRLLRPTHAIYDPDLVGPWTDAALAAAWDAISHAIESLWSARATDGSIDLATQGLARLACGIAAAPQVDWRALQQGAALAAAAIALTRTGVAHALSYPLTARHDCPHGLAAGLWTVALAPTMIAGDEPLLQALTTALATDRPVAALERLWRRTGAAAATGRYLTRAGIAAITLRDIDPVRGHASRRRIDAGTLGQAASRADGLLAR